jgi:hypothetical protein
LLVRTLHYVTRGHNGTKVGIPGSQWLLHEIALAKPPQFHIINKVILIGRLGQNDYETRTEWHRVFAWRNLSKFAKTLQKGQLVTLEGTLRYREVEDEVKGTTFNHRIAEIHAVSMKRLSKVEPTMILRTESTTSKHRGWWMRPRRLIRQPLSARNYHSSD